MAGNPRRMFILLACFFSLAGATAASAEELTREFVAAHTDGIVSRVAYEGNKRTRPAALAELCGIVKGQRVGDIDPDAVSQRLLKSGIISKAELFCEAGEGGYVVTVRVAEKWSFIPIPFASIGTESWSAGAAVLDFNAFGMRKTMLVGLLASNLGLEGAFAYVDPHFLESVVSVSVYGAYGQNSAEALTMDGQQYVAYLDNTWRAGLRFEYPGEGSFRGKFECTLRSSGLSASDAATYALDTNLLSLIPGLGLTWDGQRNSGYFSAGSYGTILYRHGIGLAGQASFDSLEASGRWSAKVFSNSFIEFGFAGVYGTTPFQLQSALSGKGFRTLPASGSYSSKDIGAYAALEIPVLTPSWCVVTLGPFYEGGIYETGLASSPGTYVFHGPGFGCRLYLNKVAFPALGLDMAYNVPAGRAVFSAYVGLSFY